MAAHPTDVILGDLLDVYRRETSRLEGIVLAALRRGIDPEALGQPGAPRGTATAAYRLRQLEQANLLITELERTASSGAPLVVGRAYRSGLVSVDRTLGDTRLAGEFGRVHVRAVEALAGNLTRSLDAGHARLRANVALTFARADALEGALPNVAGGRGATVNGLRFLGRRIDDPYRRLALETVAGGAVSLDTRRQVSSRLARRLVDEGVTDALTGFVDRAGRRWSLPSYAAMVARTTTREAMTAATTNRLREHGVDLVTITRHPHAADECTPYDGRTFSLDGATAGYPILDRLPPFHPNCAHVVGPADADLDAFERELGLAAEAPIPAAPAPELTAPAPARRQPRAPRAPVQPTPPPARRTELDRTPEHEHALSAAAQEAEDIARSAAETRTPFGNPLTSERRPDLEQRLEDQRIAYALARDPGPDLGHQAARIRAEDVDARRQVRALNEALGPDLKAYLDRTWAQRHGLRTSLLEGTLTIEDAEQLIYEHEAELEARRVLREEEASLRHGRESGAYPCEECGRFKRRPSDICDHCGRDPVWVAAGGAENTDRMRREFDRQNGYV